jgi:prolyl oligopeptidase
MMQETDPYRWLEEPSAETVAWERRQDALAEAELRGWPGYERLREAIERHAARLLVFAPRQAGDRWFRLAIGDGGSLVLLASDRFDGDGHVVVDPVRFPGTGWASLDAFFPSPDGRRVAVTVSHGGDEQSTLYVVDAETGEPGPERIPFASFTTVAWLPDCSGFFYSAGLAADFDDPWKHLFFRSLGGAERAAQPEPIGERDEYFVFPQISADGRYVAAVTNESEPHVRFVRKLPVGEWRPFLADAREGCFGVFCGDAYVAISTEDAPKGRLVSIPVATAQDRTTWTELVPESDSVLRSVSLIADTLVLARLVDGFSRLAVLSYDGVPIADVPLPGDGFTSPSGLGGSHQMDRPMVIANRDDFTFVHSTPTVAPAAYRYDVRAGRLERISAAPVELEALTVTRREASSGDGTAIPYLLVHRADLDLSQPQPALLHGYGGWNVAFAHPYLGEVAAFVEAGGMLVLANLRGGSEFGREWWTAGRLERKQNTFDDLYAVAEDLIAGRLASADRLAIFGMSNGGLLAAAAVAQRPDLFRVVVALVPLTDMLRYDRDVYTAEFAFDYGDPRDPDAARVLAAYSPYQTISDGVSYPATLAGCGANDLRCPPWHGRKFIARLQDATASDAPILLRVWPDTGHLTAGHGAPLVAEWLGFVMRHLGMSP